ncbi:MAG: DUF4258 domain-containing protein [Planctomycetales bacterium]|nr:DUF4258 domain-containing protein [Planctomycetales bacterium]
MYDRVLKRMRELIRTNQYVMTLHAEDEMEADALTVYDVESIVLNGKIVERQRDRHSGQWKYLVRGKSLGDDGGAAVVKIGPPGKLVFITVFRE